MERFKGSTARLKMKKMILDGGYFNDTEYICKVAAYEKEQANIYLLTGKTELPEISLDAIYECVLDEEEQETVCAGVIRERYWSKHGKVLVFHIENGFYKKNVN